MMVPWIWMGWTQQVGSGDIQDPPPECWGRSSQGSRLILRFPVNGGSYSWEKNHKRERRFEGERRGVVSSDLKGLTLRCQLRCWAGRSNCGSGAQVRLQAEEKRFWNNQPRSGNESKLWEGGRLSGRKQDAADPQGWLAEGRLGRKWRWSSPRRRDKPEELASATAPVYLHLFHRFCFLHPFFSPLWFLFSVILPHAPDLPPTPTEWTSWGTVVNLFLCPEYQAWNVSVNTGWAEPTGLAFILLAKKSRELAIPCLRWSDSGTSNFIQLWEFNDFFFFNRRV